MKRLKDMIKNCFKATLFGIILFFLLQIILYNMLPENYDKKLGFGEYIRYDILGEEKDTVDVVFVGDSLAYSSIIPMEIWKNHGFTMFISAQPAQVTKQSYEHVKRAISSQHPKIIMLEGDTLFRKPKNRRKESMTTKFINNYLPVIKIHNNWKKYLFTFVEEDYSNTQLNYYKGYKFNGNVERADRVVIYKETKDKYNPQSENIKYFVKIKKLCDENNVKLILISTPNGKTGSYRKHNTLEDIADRYDVEFLDLNLIDLGIDWNMETKDAGKHLNYFGALKVTKYMGDYLDNLGLLDDHRSEKKYASWDKAYNYYKQSINKELRKQ